MKKRTKKPYRALKINQIVVRALLEKAISDRLVVAVDVAKEKMVAAVMDETESVLATVKWSHPRESAEFFRLVEELGSQGHSVEVAMEPTGTYHDGLRAHLIRTGVGVFMVNPKTVHDGREFYDGVPSSHDAKAAAIIGMVHLSGRSRAFVPPAQNVVS